MKKHGTLLLAVCALLLTACSGSAASDLTSLSGQPEPRAVDYGEIIPENPEYETPVYELTPVVYGSQFQSEDGAQTVLGHYNYQIILLSLSNPDSVSPADAKAAARNSEAFNTKMRTISADLVEQGNAMAADAEEIYQEFGSLTAEYEDDVDGGADFCGDIVSVYFHRSSYTGGAHPNRYSSSYLFDLAAGQFIDPIQLAEDPEAFRAGAAGLLLEQAETHGERESFWEDYAAVIDRWNESTVRFNENGMQVTYSPYEIGPYSIGEVEFSLSWEELAPLIGESGLARLGRTAE